MIGPTEAFTVEEVQKAFDTNFYGAQRVNRAVLPQLRHQQSGLMLWISSTASKGGFPPFLGPYGAAKAAMDKVGERLSALTPAHASPQSVADEVVRIVGLPVGSRPARSVVDFVGDGAEEVLAVAERVRIDFAHRIGFDDLLSISRAAERAA